MDTTAHWIRTAEALPECGQAVRFLVERHSMWISGTYRNGFFESDWARHDAGRVQCWSPIESAELAANPEPPAV